MKNKFSKLITKIVVVVAGCLLFASFSPSLDGRAVVVNEGDFPQGLFAKTVGYLPGDIISVASIAGDSSVDLLVIGALDPSEGVAIMLSPEAASAIGIDKTANNIVKITKRSGQDERVYGTAVIAKNNTSIPEYSDEEAESFDSTIAEEKEEDFDDIAEDEEEAFKEEAEEIEEEEIEEEAVEEETVEETKEVIPEEEAPVEEEVEEEIPEETVEEEPLAEEEVEEESIEEEAPVEEIPEEEFEAEEPEELEYETITAEPEEEEAPEEAEIEEDVEEEEVAEEEAAEEEEAPVEEESIEADELDELPVEAPVEEAPVEELPEEEAPAEDEYDAIVLVPADSNPPEEEIAEVVEEVEEVETVEEITEPEPEVIEVVDEVEEITDDVIPEVKETAPATVKVSGSYKKYIVGSLSDLKSGKYYIQIASLTNDENIMDIINKYSKNYPITIVPMAGGLRKQVMIGPLNMDEYAVVLERFKSYGYKDAFLRKIK